MPKHKRRKTFPKIGDTLTGRYQGKEYRATVTAIRRGDTRTHVSVTVSGKQYASLSSAAKSITGYWVNGFVFWGVETKSKSKGD